MYRETIKSVATFGSREDKAVGEETRTSSECRLPNTAVQFNYRSRHPRFTLLYLNPRMKKYSPIK